MCVCVYVCMGVWVYGCMGVWVNGCMCAWVYECMGVLMCGCMGVSVCISVQVRDIQRLMRAHELQSLSPETKRAARYASTSLFFSSFFFV